MRNDSPPLQLVSYPTSTHNRAIVFQATTLAVEPKEISFKDSEGCVKEGDGCVGLLLFLFLGEQFFWWFSRRLYLFMHFFGWS